MQPEDAGSTMWERGSGRVDSVRMSELVTLRERHQAADTFETMLASAESNVDLWQAVWRKARVPDE